MRWPTVSAGGCATSGRFTADVAHELRTPVGGLLAAADLLPPGETEDLLRARVRDLRGLVEDLLEISRLDAGAEQPVHAQVPLGAVVSRAVARTGLDTEVTVTAGGQATVETRPAPLERISATLSSTPTGTGHPGAGHRRGPDGRCTRPRLRFPPGPVARRAAAFPHGRGGTRSGHGLGLTITLGQARSSAPNCISAPPGRRRRRHAALPA